MKKIKLFLFFLLGVLILLYGKTGIVGFGDSGITLSEGFGIERFVGSYTWSDIINGNGAESSMALIKLPLNLVFSFFELFFSPKGVQNILLIVIFGFIYFFSFLISRKIFGLSENKSILIALISLFHQYFILFYFIRFQYSLFLAPFLLSTFYLIYKYIDYDDDSINIYTIWVVLNILFFSVCIQNLAYFLPIFCILTLRFLFLIIKNKKIQKIWLIIPVLFSLLPLLIPYFISIVSNVKKAYIGVSPLGTMEIISQYNYYFANLLNINFIKDTVGFGGFVDGSQNFYQNKYYQIINALFFSYILFLVLFKKEKKQKKYFLIILIYLLAIFLSNAFYGPLSSLYTFVYSKASFVLNGFRNPIEKNIILFYFTYLILVNIAFTLEKKKNIFIFTLLILCINIFAYLDFDFYDRKIAVRDDSFIQNLSIIYQIPKDYYKLKNLFISQKGDFKILNLPLINYDHINYRWDSGYEGSQHFYRFFNKPILQIDNSIKQISFLKNVFFNQKSEKKDLEGLFLSNNILYVILDKNAIYNSHKYGNELLFTYEDYKYLLDQTNYSRIYNFGDILLYEYAKKGNFSFIGKGYFSFVKINPTKYHMSIKNLSGSYTLSFLQSYHNEWKFYPSKRQIDCSISEQEIYNSYDYLTGEAADYTGTVNLTGIVLSGDSWQTLAKKYKFPVSKLKNMNPGVSVLQEGEEIVVGTKEEKFFPDFRYVQTGTGNVTECINQNYTFFQGEELKYLWEKPVFDDTHKLVNEYANGRTLDADYIKKNFPKEYYKENADGSIDVNLTLYFKPQSYFYLGLGVSGLTFLGLMSWLIIDWRRSKKSLSDLEQGKA